MPIFEFFPLLIIKTRFDDFFLNSSWLNYQWVDNSGVLQWLVQVLHEAELAGEKVHIMGHIPPGNGDCLGAWGRNYAKIIERYINWMLDSTHYYYSLLLHTIFSFFLKMFRNSSQVWKYNSSSIFWSYAQWPIFGFLRCGDAI